MEQIDSIKQLCVTARRRAAIAGCLPLRVRDDVIRLISERLVSGCPAVLEANRRDVELAQGQLPSDFIDRLRLDENRISALRDRLLLLASQPDPLWHGRITRSGDEQVTQLTSPVGTVAFIYNGCPELTALGIAACVKSGNSALLMPGVWGSSTDAALIECIRASLSGSGYPPEAIVVADGSQPSLVLGAVRGECGTDMVFHRGPRRELIRLKNEARVPVVAPGQGISHIYIDGTCDVASAVALTMKSVYPRDIEAGASVVLLVNSRVAANYLSSLERGIQPYRPEYRACPIAREHLTEAVPAVRDDWSADGLSDGNIIAVRVVATAEEAIEHINTYGTAPEQAIISDSLNVIRRFCREVAAREVCVNIALPHFSGVRPDWFVRTRTVAIG